MWVKTWNEDLRRSFGIQSSNEKPVVFMEAGCCGKGDALAVRRYRGQLVVVEVQFVRRGYLETDLCGCGRFLSGIGRDPKQRSDEKCRGQASRKRPHALAIATFRPAGRGDAGV